MNALSLRPSTDEDAQALISLLNEERRLSARRIMPRLGIYPDVVGQVCAIVKLIHIARRANRSIEDMGFSICIVGGGRGLDAEYGIEKHYQPPE